MKIYLVFCAVFFCWTIVDGQKASVDIPPDPAHGTVYCIDFEWDKICQVKCDDGYEPERPHAQYYEYKVATKQWETGGKEFPWADCVLPSK